MNDQFEIKQKANNLRKAGNYSEAITIYKELWNNSTVKDKWVGWGFAYCLTHIKEYETALNICNEVFNIDPEFVYIKSVYAQCIYLGKIKSFDEKASLISFELTISDLLQKCEGTEFRKFVDLSILEFVKLCADKFKWDDVLKWLKTIDPQKLDTEEFRGTNSEGKHFVKPSPKETYYHKYSKALNETEQFQECLKTSDEGLSFFPKSVWFKYYKANALRKLQNYQEAIKLFEKVKLTKKDWFVLNGLAAAYYCSGSIDLAYQTFLEAVNGSVNVPNPEFRTDLYFLGALILDKKNMPEQAALHSELACKLRSEIDWKIPGYIFNDRMTRNVTGERTAKEIFNILRKFWRDEEEKIFPVYEGRISKLLESGAAGFISLENKESIFFKFSSVIGNKGAIKPGVKVSFNIKNSFDTKKNKESEAAFNVKIVG
ncbi:MAG: hypothetical protein IAE91_02345 [Ignavibacteriaceae bacterium]|nr:hypothetical protein [Ignavibacteriaceae bacterium]